MFRHPSTIRSFALRSPQFARLLTVVLAFWFGLPLMIHAAEAVPTPSSAASSSLAAFEKDVLPLFKTHCLECHAGKSKKGGLDLTNANSLLLGGHTGAAIVAGAAEKSLLIEMLKDGSMPPDNRKPLNAEEVKIVRDWINAYSPNADASTVLPTLSAEDRYYWAFQKPSLPTVPTVKAANRVRTPVDAFVLSRLEKEGLGFSPDAERLTILRRVYFDLLGLPPTPAEIDAWLADTSATAYEKLIDRLLESPHYGERWGRHWLDSAGYADTIKTDNDINGGAIRDGMWRYRDYVVRAFNSDKPYDQFLREQLAGDEMTGVCNWNDYPPEAITPQMKELLTATGMLRTSVDGTNNFERNRPQERHEVLFDTVENLTSNLFGLTVACARCHDHKFDPVSQRDYYGIVAFLTPSYNLNAWVQPQNRHIVISTKEELADDDKFNKQIDKQAGELGGQAAKLRRPVETRLFEAKVAMLPEAIREDVRVTLKTGGDKRTEVQKYLFEKFDPVLRVSREETLAAMSVEDRATVERLDFEVEDLRAKKRNPQKIQAMFEQGSLPATHLLRRGNFETPGPEVPPAIPAVLEGTLSSEVDHFENGTSGRRLAMAQSLTEPGSRAAGLVGRVFVNRVWQNHFGRGIVPTSGNFGRSGEAPTHPELLEWLTADFLSNGWKVKRLHKMLMMSSVYRQASTYSAETTKDSASVVDPDNRLLWRMPLRRLESEIIRDSILAVSGRLDETMGGPPVLLEGRPDGQVVINQKGLATPTSPWRRSIYLLARRNFGLSMLSVFDQPLMGTNCTKRGQSVVVSQSLSMLNDEFVMQSAEQFAVRVREVAGTSEDEQIRAAFRFALARYPSAAEQQWSREFLNRQTAIAQQELAATEKPAGTASVASPALKSLCQMLLNTNEFLYIE